MSELRRLSDELGKGLPLGGAGMHSLLQLVGARGSAVGLALLLGELSRLCSAFDLLGEAYPAVRPWTTLLGHVDAVLRRLEELSKGSADNALAISVRRVFEGSPDGLLGVSQMAGFVEVLACNPSPVPVAKLVRAAAYLAGVVRQATHTLIPDCEDASDPDSWLLQVVHDFTPLAEHGVGTGVELNPGDPLAELASECALWAQREGDRRLPGALAMLGKLFKSGRTRSLGAQVQAYFDTLARLDESESAPDGGDCAEDGDDDDVWRGDLSADDDPGGEDEPFSAGASALSPSAPADAAVVPGKGKKPRAPWKRGDRPSSGLSERQILKEHRRAFLPSEQDELTALIERALAEPARVYPGSRPSSERQFELLVAAMACCLARTIASAAETRIVNFELMDEVMPVHLPRTRCIFISHLEAQHGESLQVGYADDEDFAMEHRAAGWTLLPLPVVLSDWLRQLAPDILDATLEELLPFIPGGWSASAGQWLASKFGRFNGSLGDFNLANRHALARSLFAATSNRALVELACTELRTASGKLARTIALSAYLKPGSTRDKLEYLRAATALISASSEVPLPSQWWPEFTAIPAEVLQALSKRLTQQAIASSSARQRHEAVAVHTLLGLVLGTGHRQSAHIFHFPWDLDLEQAVAFVCDKLTIGSEARFIPLVPRLVEMVHVYRRHVMELIAELKGPQPKLAREIAAATGLPSPGRRGKNHLAEGHHVGQFFLIRGESIVPIGTDALDKRCRQLLADAPEALLLWDLAPGSGSLLQRLRRNIATYLWTGGLSGTMVEAFLGHNRKLHIFGEASTWSVLGDLTRVLPLVERYLDAADWQPLDLGGTADKTVSPAIQLPLRRTGVHAYEGRERAASLAKARARRMIRQVVLGLTDDPDERITLDDDAISALCEEAALALGEDPAARNQLLQAFASLSDELRFKHGISISAVDVATRDQEPGPVEVGFARDLALADAIRSGWPSAVLELMGEASKDKKASEQVWLAVLATSLVVNDALLDPQQLWPILECIYARKALAVEGRVQVRATVQSPRAEFERVVYLSQASSAAVIGLHRVHKTVPPPQREIDRQGVDAQIAGVVDAVPGMPAGTVAGLSTLASLFRAWWFLRLPGVAYAIATGKRDAPSCDQVTESTLLGANPPRDTARTSKLRAARRATVDEEIAAGSDAIRKLLERAQGQQQQGTQGSRRQRRELRQLFQQGLPDELTALMAAVPMANLRVGFIEYLLVNGGLEKDVLAFGTILAYDGRLKDLYARWWRTDPLTFSSRDFDDAYAELLRSAATPGNDPDVKSLRTALRNFHAFLRQSERVPDAPVLGLRFSQAHRRMPRSALLAPRLFEASLEAVRALAGDDFALAERSLTLLTLCHAFGTRREEALYSCAQDYAVRAGALALRVQSNAVNKLKNPTHGTRLVPFGLAGDDSERMLRAVVTAAATGLHSDKPLFADPTAINRFVDFQSITGTAIAALKLAAGNSRMTLHGERHGFGTRIGMAMTRAIGQMLPVARIRQELAVDAVVAERISELKPSSLDWPFQIDRAGMWHGNAGVANYLDVYFHGGCWLLAEHADANAIGELMHPGHWAALMGMNRTNIVHLRGSWRRREGEGANLSIERVVGHFLEMLKLPNVQTLDVCERGQSTGKTPEIQPAATRRFTLAMADSLLVRRCEEQWGLDEAGLIAESEMRLRRDDVQGFINSYREFVADTGFIDYEPDGSELMPGNVTHRAGASRSAPRRQALLSRLEDLQKKSPLRRAVESLLTSWRQWVNPKRPMLVIRQPEDLKQAIDVLLELGFGRRELRLLVTPNWSQMHGEMSIGGLVPERRDVARFSRGPDAIAVAEAGIEVIGRLEEALLSNADLHRALVVACAHKG